MAAEVRLVRLTWENGQSFKLDTKLDAGAYITILEMDENGNINELWKHAGELCKQYFNSQVNSIGEVMKGS